MSDLWPNQSYGIQAVIDAVAAGERHICLTAPTGAGKTRIMCELIERMNEPTVLYTNRRMLLEQTAERLTSHGIQFGIRAAGHEPDISKRVQLAMIQTEDSRVFRKERTTLHWARLVLIDEAHVNAAGSAGRICTSHLDDGARLVGFTATPLGIGHLYDHLIQAGVPSELRSTGALLRATVYAPDEPDARGLKHSVKTGEFTEAAVRKAIMTRVIFGRVFDHWRQYNPDARPAILFAPGVPESIWFCEQFAERGVRCAHIDGEKCWLDGEEIPSSQEARDHIADLSRSGELAIVANRFVLREGIDWPWLYHGILATCFGSLTSYLQSVGRLLRASPGLESVCIQDHGGNWHRHGSPNADREWNLDDTAYKLACERQERMRTKKEPEPITCPRCHAVRLSGPECFACGFRHTTKSRMVIQQNGRLVRMDGDIYRERPVSNTPQVEKDWKSVYYRLRNSNRDFTFKQALGLFAKEHHGQYPPRDLPLMPLSDQDWYRRIKDVPYSDLVQTRKTPDPQKEMAFQ